MSTPIRRAIYGRLAGDNTLNEHYSKPPQYGGTLVPGLLGTPAPGYSKSIYHEVAPDNANFPYIIFSKSSGVPTEAFTDPSALETDVWMVKAVDGPRSAGTVDYSTSADNAESISARAQTLLNDGTISISGGTALYLRRQSDIEYAEVNEGIVYRHVGSLYRLVYE